MRFPPDILLPWREEVGRRGKEKIRARPRNFISGEAPIKIHI
jgi:hypothetical protein